MKQRYTKVPLFLAFFTLLFYLPIHLHSQCLCSGGAAPQTIVYNQTGTISPSTDSTDFIFPKFDPTVGVLACVRAEAYVTSVVRMRLENDEIFDVYNYRIRYTRNDGLFGPGINPPVTGTLIKNYGPYFLAASDGTYFSGLDFMTLGPDTVYKNKLFDATTTNVIDYLGPGSVTFTYRVLGSTIVTGSSNYIFSISANDQINFRMTYSYCTTGLLPIGIKDFSASKKDKQNVALNWLAENETPNTTYDIEVSPDGTQFQKIGNTQSKLTQGSATKYEYLYHLNTAITGKLYFRIKSTQLDGKTTYSIVRTVNMEELQTDGMNIFPNPASRRISMQFDRSLKGDYAVELTNLMGQIVYKRNIKIDNSNIIQLELTNPPAAGVYYLRAKDLQTQKVFTGKLFIQQ